MVLPVPQSRYGPPWQAAPLSGVYPLGTAHELWRLPKLCRLRREPKLGAIVAPVPLVIGRQTILLRSSPSQRLGRVPFGLLALRHDRYFQSISLSRLMRVRMTAGGIQHRFVRTSAYTVLDELLNTRQKMPRERKLSIAVILGIYPITQIWECSWG